MTLPKVPLTIVTGGGIAATLTVVSVMKSAAEIRRDGRANQTQFEKYKKRYQAHQAAVTQTNGCLQAFGATQTRARIEVTLRMQDFLERHAKQVQTNEDLILDGVDARGTRVISMPRLDADVANWVRGIVTAVTIGRAAPDLAKESVSKLGSASTGNRLSNLHGAAAEKATLAFFGGGSIKSGGGGMKLGNHMLNIVSAIPMLLSFELTMRGQRNKSKKHSGKFQTEIDEEIALLDIRDEHMRGVRLRAKELDDILVRLIDEATASLDLLESEEFIMPDHAERLQAALILQRAVRDVAITPVANEDGELDERTDDLIFKYREPSMEVPND